MSVFLTSVSGGGAGKGVVGSDSPALRLAFPFDDNTQVSTYMELADQAQEGIAG